jgi:5-methylcytosine-specific restriction endonuclease McrA
MGHALVLNASYEPLQIVTWQKAIQLLFQGKVEVVEESSTEVHSVKITIKVPAVLRLLEYVPLKRKKQVVKFSRINVFIRDQFCCQYCGKNFVKSQLTLDHVIPVVQGGGKNWENIVTACKPCNQKKGGRTPNQAKMNLVRSPFRPIWLPATAIRMTVSKTPDRWKIYLNLLRDENKDDDLDDST